MQDNGKWQKLVEKKEKERQGIGEIIEKKKKNKFYFNLRMEKEKGWNVWRSEGL